MLTRLIVVLAATAVLAAACTQTEEPPAEGRQSSSVEDASAETPEVPLALADSASSALNRIEAAGEKESTDEVLEEGPGTDSALLATKEEPPQAEERAVETPRADSAAEPDSDPGVSATPAATRPVSPAGLHIMRAYVCRGIEQSEPTEAGKSFIPEPDGLLRLCCFSEIGGAAQPDTVYHVWYWGDREMARVALSVKSSRWRTWSTKKILNEWRGQWRIDVTDKDGFVLASLDFSVE
jgi:hypothetical protein